MPAGVYAVAALIPFSEALRLDAELVRLARGASALRLAVGSALDALGSSSGHHELGFSSLEACARERCERTGRWAADSRALAQRLESLPETRAALQTGAIGWSTAELLARHVSAESERSWLETARRVTVRELRKLLANGEVEHAGVCGDGEKPTRRLTVSATREDGWLFECARKVVETVAGPQSSDRLLQSLLAEGYSTLLELVPDRTELCELETLESDVSRELEAQAAWCAERKRWRDEAERSNELVLAVLESDANGVSSLAVTSSRSAESLDREIRRLCAELSERDLALGIVAESARKAEVWRRLGFVSEEHYARERVGVSLSSLKAKRILAARAARVPELSAALASGRIGYEAAYVLSRVVTPKTAEEWIRLAERRTVKHLKEEVEAAEVSIRAGHGREARPLDEESLDALFELERCIVSGDWLGRARDAWALDGAKRETGVTRRWQAGNGECPGGGQMFGGGTTNGESRGGGQMSGGGTTNGESRGGGQMSGGRTARRRGVGRVTMRWNVTESTYCFWRALERAFSRVATRSCRAPSSFLGFLCENFCRIWLPALRQGCLTDAGALPEYFGVYRRDVFRCASPVCSRRDVTSHHLVFRSRGGSDEDENVASLCSWCHLHGVHEGRIAAEPPASKIRWRIGRSGTLRVEGRTKVSYGLPAPSTLSHILKYPSADRKSAPRSFTVPPSARS